jgi:hypothetical protein
MSKDYMSSETWKLLMYKQLRQCAEIGRRRAGHIYTVMKDTGRRIGTGIKISDLAPPYLQLRNKIPLSISCGRDTGDIVWRCNLPDGQCCASQASTSRIPATGWLGLRAHHIGTGVT